MDAAAVLISITILLVVFLGSGIIVFYLVVDEAALMDRITLDSCPGPMLGLRFAAGRCDHCEAYHFDIFIYIGWTVIILSLGQRPVEA